MMNRRRALIAEGEAYFLKPANRYVDTGITANPYYCFEVGFEWTNTPVGNEYIFGVTNNVHQTRYHSLQGTMSDGQRIIRAYRCDSPTINDGSVTIAGGIRYDIRLDFTSSTCDLNINRINTHNSSVSLPVAETTYYFGACHWDGTSAGQWLTQEMKIYYFRIFSSTNSTVPILEYKPKTINGEVVLYNTITNQPVTWVSQ